MVFMPSKRKLLAKKGTLRVVLKKDPQYLAGTEIEVKQLDFYCVSKQEETWVESAL